MARKQSAKKRSKFLNSGKDMLNVNVKNRSISGRHPKRRSKKEAERLRQKVAQLQKENKHLELELATTNEALTHTGFRLTEVKKRKSIYFFFICCLTLQGGYLLYHNDKTQDFYTDIIDKLMQPKKVSIDNRKSLADQEKEESKILFN